MNVEGAGFRTWCSKTWVRVPLWRSGVLCLVLSTAASARASEHRIISEEELLRRTQQLFDAVAIGDPAPWQRYIAADALFFDEKGRNMDKTALLKDLAPLPKGYSGAIRIAGAQSRIIGDTAVLSYDLSETEVIFGQHLTARYHATDTWMYRGGKWQIIASQIFRFYEDPAIGESDPKLADLYVGTYQLGPGVTMQITREHASLYAQRTGRPREELLPEATGIFFRKGVEGRRLFHVAADGKVDYLIDRRNNQDVIWKKID